MTTLLADRIGTTGRGRHCPALVGKNMKIADIYFCMPLDLVGGVLALLNKGFTLSVDGREPLDTGDEVTWLTASKVTDLDKDSFFYRVSSIIEPFNGGCITVT